MLVRRGPFLLSGREGSLGNTLRPGPLVHTEPGFSTVEIQGSRQLWRGVGRGDGQVYDVGHIAGSGCGEQIRPPVWTRFFLGRFWVLLATNEKGHRVVPLLLRGTGYVPGRTSAEPVILTGTGSKLAPGKLHEDEHDQHDQTHNKPVTVG